MIPVGPLHPADAVYALGFGLAVAAVAFRSAQRWPVLVVVSAVAVMAGRHPGDISRGFVQRPAPWGVALVALGVAAVSWSVTAVRGTPVASVAMQVVVACAAVWMVVPDTESPLIAGSVVVGAMLFVPRDSGSLHTGMLWVLPAAAAVIGSVGMPDRLFTALAAAAAGVAGTLIVQQA